MRIAHINNISGVASIIAKQQRKEGHNIEVFVFNKIIYKQFGGTKFNYYLPLSRWKFFRRLNEYDIWHYHYPYGSLKRSLDRRHKDKIYLKHYHGNDIRGMYDDDFCVVSTPDLLQYAPNGKWLPNPIDLIELESIIPLNQKQTRITKIAHYPYYQNYDSNDYYTTVLSEIGNEKKSEVVRISNLSHIKTLETISSCDIVIGKILPDVGWFGKFELEGMALGKPVITYVSDELYEKYKPSVYRTTENTFKRDLEGLIEDIAERDRLCKEGQAYIKKYHSMEVIFKALNEYYRKI
jgi:glycosyltransferase involved in cell wall biosynthesis